MTKISEYVKASLGKKYIIYWVFQLAQFMHIPYILAYKSRNFGQNLAKILSIRLIRGSNVFGLKTGFYHLFVCFKTILTFWRRIKNLNFGPFLVLFFSIRLIRGSTYTRVYTVIDWWNRIWAMQTLRAQKLCQCW